MVNGLYLIYAIAIPLMDINDLIRGWWFYHNWVAAIIWNVVFLCSLFLLIKKEKQNDNN